MSCLKYQKKYICIMLFIDLLGHTMQLNVLYIISYISCRWKQEWVQSEPFQVSNKYTPSYTNMNVLPCFYDMAQWLKAVFWTCTMVVIHYNGVYQSTMVFPSVISTVQWLPPQYFLCKVFSEYKTMQLLVKSSKQKDIIES